MTETSPLATTSDYVGDFRTRTRRRSSTSSRCKACRSVRRAARDRRRRQGDPLGRRGDGRARGARPLVAAGYYETPEQAERWTEDGWFKTGDIASFHPKGYVMIKDRSKDVIKSGGEWISSVDLENALMAHPAIAEAAVIAIPHEKWDERPLAVCVCREGKTATAGRAARVPRPELRQVLAAGRVRVRRRDSEDGRRQVPQDRAGGAVRERAGFPVVQIREDLHRHGWPLRARRGHRGDARGRGRDGVIADLPETDVTDEARCGARRLVRRAARSRQLRRIGGGARVIGFPLDRFRKIVEVNLIGTFNVLSRSRRRRWPRTSRTRRGRAA